MTQPTRTPYAPKRPAISKEKRTRIFLAHGGICWICRLKIMPYEPFDIDHQVSRELGGSDDDDNLAPAHKTPCHRDKSKQDVAMIAKSNRIRRNLDPETRRKTRHPIPKPKNFKWASRPFPKRGDRR